MYKVGEFIEVKPYELPDQQWRTAEITDIQRDHVEVTFWNETLKRMDNWRFARGILAGYIPSEHVRRTMHGPLVEELQRRLKAHEVKP